MARGGRDGRASGRRPRWASHSLELASTLCLGQGRGWLRWASHSLDVASILCSVTARSSTVLPSSSVAVWCAARLDANASTSPRRSKRSMYIFSSTEKLARREGSNGGLVGQRRGGARSQACVQTERLCCALGQCVRALVLEERAEQTRAVRPGGGEHGASDGHAQRGDHVLFADGHAAEGAGGELRQLVVARRRLEELALRVQDARVAHLTDAAVSGVGGVAGWAGGGWVAGWLGLGQATEARWATGGEAPRASRSVLYRAIVPLQHVRVRFAVASVARALAVPSSPAAPPPRRSPCAAA